jgi:large repetitive protein
MGTSVAFGAIAVYDAATLIGTTTADASGNWSVTVAGPLSVGVYSITATATASGATSVPSGALSVTIDTATTVTLATPASGSTLATGTPVISGTAEAGSWVAISRGTTLLTTVVANGAGAWTFTPTTALTDGSLTLNAVATDLAGNTASASTTITIDTVAPVAPSAPDLAAASDTGVSNTDNVTSITTPVLSGTAEPNSTVKLYDGATLISTVTADAAGAWTLSPAFTTGTHVLTTTATDAVGNISPVSAALSITVDTTAPTAPSTPDLVAASDSGTSSTDDLTNVTTPTFSGTVEVNATVKLYEGATVVGTTTADGSGNWTIALGTTLAAGPHAFKAEALDAAGNTSSQSAALTIIIDTTTTVAITAPASGSSTASSQPTISGTAEANATVVVKNGITTIGTTSANALGNWSLTPAAALADGVRSISAVATDIAGNAATSSTVNVTVDTTAPSVPSAPTLNVASNSGSTTDTITSITMPTISGTAEAGATVSVYDGGTLLGTAIANGSGAWSFTPSTGLSAGAHSLTVTARDTLGNTSAASSALSITIDTAAPSVPSIDLTASSDSGVSDTDNITSVTLPTLTGTAEAGATVKVYEGATLLGTTTADGTGTWTVTLTTALATGTHSLTATATDVAANTSLPSSTLDITIDTTGHIQPTAPLLQVSSNTGSTADTITSNTRPVIIAGGTEIEASATVRVYDNDVLVATTTADASGFWSYQPTAALSNGNHVFTITATDAAGNVSAPSPALTVVIDNAAPTTPFAPTLDPASNTGSTADTITADTTPTINGTAEAHSTVTIYDGATLLGTTTANGTGVWSFTPPATMTDGVHLFTVTATDVAGNVSTASATLSVTITTAAPGAAAAPALGPSSNSGSTTDTITSYNTPTLTGTAAANSTVSIYDGATLLGTTTADGTGNWTFTPTSGLSDGTHSITVTVTDVANNTSAASSALSITVDTTSPAATAPTLHESSNSGALTDTITKFDTPTIIGSAEPGALVHVYDGATLLGTTTADTAGSWAFTPTTSLADGTHPITTTATDAASNVSAASTSLALVIDTIAPPATSSPTLDPASNTASLTDSITSVTAPIIHGTTEAGALVTVYDGATLLATVTADNTGAWTLAVAGPLTDGLHRFAFTATDTADNVSGSSPKIAVTIDTAAPTAPSAATPSTVSDSGVSGDLITNVTAPTLIGTSEANATVNVYQAGVLVGTVSSDSSANWSFTSAALAAGSYAFTSTATDTAGNVSVISAATTLTIDTAAPSAPPAAVLLAASDSGTAGDNITNVVTPTITGTAEANATITVFDNGVQIGTTTATAGGTFSFTTGTLADGAHAITTTATDVAANTSSPSVALDLAVDTTAPTAPAAAVLAPASDSGVSGDNRTNSTTPTFTGTGEAGSTITIYDGTTLLGTATAATDGTWTFTTSTLPVHTVVLTTTSSDAAGNTSLPSSSLTVVIDITAPATATAPTLDPTSDSGVLGDKRTNVTTPTIAGTSEALATIKVYDETTSLGTTTAATDGTWTFTSPALANGAHPITTTATDAAGNSSAASAALTLTIDNAAPAAPAALVLDPASDSGTAGDNTTNVTTAVITGAAEAGATVSISRGGTSVGSVVADASGAWAYTSDALVEGTYQFTATATDAAGNTSITSAALAITIDTTAPVAPTTVALASTSDSGVTGDNRTSVTTPTLTGTAEAGSTVTVYDGATSLGTTTVAADGTWSVVSPTLTSGTHAITARSTDAAGNTSTASAAVTLVIDTAAPVALGVAVLNPASDSGTAGDKITSDNTPTITGTAEADATITIYRNGVTAGTVVASATGAWTFTSPTVSDGSSAFTTTATDAAGNVSVLSAPLSLTIDTATPAAPSAVALSPTSDSGLAGDNTTSITTPVITGSGEAGATISVYDGATLLGTTTATADGSWTFTSPTLSNGAHPISTTGTDPAGNVSVATSALTLTIDTVAPAAPSTAALTAASDSGVAGDNLTGITTPSLIGTAQANATITIYRNGVSVGTVVADNTGAWSYTSTTLADGTVSFTTTSTDAAGNVSSLSDPLSITIDTAAPTVPSQGALAPSSDSGALGDNRTNDATPSFTGTGDIGSTIKLYEGATLLGSTTVAADGTWSVTSSTLTDGAHSVATTSTDAAGNISTLATPTTVTIDTTAPVAPSTANLAVTSDSGTVGDKLTAIATPTIVGTGEAGTTIRVYDDGTFLGTAIVAANGSWSFTTATLTDRVHPFTTTSTDASGNVSATSASFSLTIDTTVPPANAAPVLSPSSDSGVAGDAITNIVTPTLTGSGTAGSTVTVYDDGASIGTTTVAANGTWSFVTPTLASGVHPLTATATNAAGTASAPSLPTSVTIDTTAPTAPPVAVLAAASDTGVLGDNLTNSTIPTLTGAGEPGSTITLFDGGDVIGTATVTAGGLWSFTTATLADGTHPITTTSTDEAGNISALSDSLALIIDTTAPTAPPVASLATGSDSGVTGDNLTRITTPTLTGSAEAGATVRVYDGATLLGTTTVAADGTWAFTTTSLADDIHSFTTTATDAAGNVSGASPALAISVATQADLWIISSHTGVIVPGATVTYSVTVTNNGVGDAFDATIVDTLPAGLTFSSSTSIDPAWSCNAFGQVVTCHYAGVLTPTTWTTASITATVASGVTGAVSNSASVSSVTHDATLTNNTTTADVATAVPSADVSVTPTHGARLVAGTSTTYSVIVANAGPSNAAGPTTVTATLPTGMSYTSLAAASTTAGWTCNAADQVVTCTNPATLVAHTASTLDLTVGIASAAATGSADASVTANTATTDPITTDNSATVTGTIAAEADLVLTSTNPQAALAGSPSSYSFDVRNAGPSQAADATVVETLPAGVTFVRSTSAGWSCAAAGQVVTCNRGAAISTGSTTLLVIETNVAAGAATLAAHTATLTSTTTDPVVPNTVTTSAASTGASADLSVAVTHPSTLITGAASTYTVTVSNAGPSDAAGPITVTATLPTGLTSTGTTTPGWTCAGSTSISCTNPASLANTSSTPLVLNVAVAATAVLGSVDATFVVASASTDPSSANNTKVDTSALTASADLGLTLVPGGTFVAGASTGTFTASVKNNGASPAANATVAVTLPTGVTLAPDPGTTEWTCTGTATATCVFAGPLAVGSTTSVTFPVAIAANVTAAVSVTGALSSTTADPASANNTVAPSPVALTTSADLALTALTTGPIITGQDNTVTFTATNNGPSQAAGDIVLTITLAPGVTFGSSAGAGWICVPVGQVVTCTNASPIASAASLVVTFTIAVSGTAAGQLITASSLTSTTSDPNNANNSLAANALPILSKADLGVTLTHSGTATPGTDMTYTATVVNNGPAPASGPVTVTNTLPAGMSFVPIGSGAAPFACTATGQVVTCSDTGILPLGTVSFPIKVHVAPSLPDGNVNNAATITTPSIDANNANNSTSDATSVTPDGDLSLTMVRDNTPIAGTNVSYTMTVTNNGPSDSSSFHLVNVLPANTTYLSSNQTGNPLRTLSADMSDLSLLAAPAWACVPSGTAVSCDYGVLPVGAKVSIRLTLAIASSATGLLTMSASVTGPSGETNSANNAVDNATLIVTQSGIVVTTTPPASVIQGQDALFTVNTQSFGPSDLGLTTITLPVPAGANFVSAAGSGWACTSNGTVVTCVRSTLAATAWSKIALTVRPTGRAALSVQPSALATTLDGTDAPPQVLGATTATNGGIGRFVPLPPRRILDTRDGNGAPQAKLSPGQTINVQMTGRAGVPSSGVSAVVFNLTGTSAQGEGGFVTAWPTGGLKPNASSLNLEPGSTVANLVTVTLGDGGMVSLNSFATADLVADIAGYYEPVNGSSTAGRFVPVNPARVLDSRNAIGLPTTSKVPADGTVKVQITGQGGIPLTGVSAVVANLTATEADSPGFVTAWPSGDMPVASNVNLDQVGQTRPNQIILPVSESGTINLKTTSGVHLIVDLAGYFTDSTAEASTSGLFVALSPERILDTRNHIGTVGGKPAPRDTVNLAVAGHANIPMSGASTLVANVTATAASGPGFVTAWPSGDIPNASNLNLDIVGQTSPNQITTLLGADGTLNLFTFAGTHLIVDVAGYYMK